MRNCKMDIILFQILYQFNKRKFIEILILLIIISILFKQITVAVLLAGFLWFIFGFSVEKKVWLYYFCNHLRDRLASMLIVSFFMVGSYLVIYDKYGNICIMVPFFGQIVFDFCNIRSSKKPAPHFWFFFNMIIVELAFLFWILTKSS